MTSTTRPQRLAVDHQVFQAWMEDNDFWDGYGLYLDLEVAKAHAAADYESDEYPEFDEDEPTPRPEFTWAKEHGMWHLADHGKDTLVRLSTVSVYRPATPGEVAEQDRARAEREAASRAKYAGMSFREALEAEARERGITPATPAA